MEVKDILMLALTIGLGAAGWIITDTRAWVRSVQKQAQAENAELREKLAVLDREAQRWANCKCVEIDSKLADYKTQALLLFAAKNDLGEISKRMDAGFAKLDDRLNLLFQKLDGKQDKKGRE